MEETTCLNPTTDSLVSLVSLATFLLTGGVTRSSVIAPAKEIGVSKPDPSSKAEQSPTASTEEPGSTTTTQNGLPVPGTPPLLSADMADPMGESAVRSFKTRVKYIVTAGHT